MHFAPHRPRAEFLRHPGSGGLRGATRPAPQHPLRAHPSAGSRLHGCRAAAPSPRAESTRLRGRLSRGWLRAWERREHACAGAGACGWRGARPSAAAGLLWERRAAAETNAPWNGAVARNQVGDGVGEWGVQCPPPPQSSSSAPKPLEINNLSKYCVVAMQPLQTISLASRSNQLRLSEPRPRRKCCGAAARALEVAPQPTSAPNHVQPQPRPWSTPLVPA